MTAEVDPKLLPPRDGDAPLHELTRDQLSAFLYVAFNGEELLGLLRELKVPITGGYRLEALDDGARADLLADELRALPRSRAAVIKLLGEIYEFPALEAVVLPPVVAEEVSALAVESDAPVRMLWRLLADPSAEIRKAAHLGLDALVAQLFGPPPEGEAPPVEQPGDQPAQPQEAPDARELRKEVRRVGAKAERAQEKAETLREQLKAARQEQARLEREAAQKSKESARLAQELERTREKLADARKKTQRDELERLEKERAELAARVSVLDERLKASAEAREKLESELESARREAGSRPRQAEAPKVEEGEAVEALPSTWLFPRFTREFYDSLEGWEPRIQRAAFKQAYLLAENHRHPSLRAIPLEGIPGYYRVRIATDVRLIYRRTENEREVEILSLIDREDLDRYVRQAKTR